MTRSPLKNIYFNLKGTLLVKQSLNKYSTFVTVAVQCWQVKYFLDVYNSAMR